MSTTNNEKIAAIHAELKASEDRWKESQNKLKSMLADLEPPAAPQNGNQTAATPASARPPAAAPAPPAKQATKPAPAPIRYKKFGVPADVAISKLKERTPEPEPEPEPAPAEPAPKRKAAANHKRGLKEQVLVFEATVLALMKTRKHLTTPEAQSWVSEDLSAKAVNGRLSRMGERKLIRYERGVAYRINNSQKSTTS